MDRLFDPLLPKYTPYMNVLCRLLTPLGQGGRLKIVPKRDVEGGDRLMYWGAGVDAERSDEGRGRCPIPRTGVAVKNPEMGAAGKLNMLVGAIPRLTASQQLFWSFTALRDRWRPESPTPACLGPSRFPRLHNRPIEHVGSSPALPGGEA